MTFGAFFVLRGIIYIFLLYFPTHPLVCFYLLACLFVYLFRSKEMERILNEQLQLLNEMNRRLKGNEEGTGRRIMNWFGLR